MVEDDDPTGIPGVNKPGMAGSMASRPPEQQQKFMDNEAIGVAKACLNSRPNEEPHPDLSQEAIMAIASSTLEMSAFIAGRVDRWAVGQQMMDRPADDPFGDHHVADQAQKEMEAWISDTERRVKALAGSNDVVTPLQLKARELFFEKCHHALRTGLTKHDQVLVTEKSALKHSQNIPTCVACNRPLPTKRSKGEKVRADRARAEKPATPKKQHREKDDPEYVMRGGFRMPKSLDGADPAQPCCRRCGPRRTTGRHRGRPRQTPGAPRPAQVDPRNAAGGVSASPCLCPPVALAVPARAAAGRAGGVGRVRVRRTIAATARGRRDHRSEPRVGCADNSSPARWYDAHDDKGAVRVSSAGGPTR